MNTTIKFGTAMLLASVFFWAGYFANRIPAVSANAGTTAHSLSYTCPMHPDYRSDHAGQCPSCGMRLVSVGAAADEKTTTDHATGRVTISPERQQLFGIRTELVEQASGKREIRLPGRVTADEQRVYRLVAAVDGWVRKLGNNPAGDFVKKNQILASYYTPNLVNATQTFVFALHTNAQSQSGDATIGYQRGTTQLSLQVALDSLRSAGMNEQQIEKIRETRVAPDAVDVYSPIDGIVLARNISPEQRFDKGSEMYRIADLSQIWIIADVFEKDRDLLKAGVVAVIHYGGRDYRARLSSIIPQIDSESRTLKARFELDNPGYTLRPGDFLNLDVASDASAEISIPADAVIDTGKRQTVFVDRGNGAFESRAVELGAHATDRVQVINGLEPGERVVVSGAFLIDSEAKMRHTDSASVSAGSTTRGPA